MRRAHSWRGVWGLLVTVGLCACGGPPSPEEVIPGAAEETVEAQAADDARQSHRPHGETRWAQAASGPDEDRGLSVAHDSHGNVYSLGRFFGTADFGTGPQGPGGNTLSMGIGKYRPDGSLAWARVFPTTATGLVSGSRVAVDPRDDLIVTGAVLGGGDLGGGPLPDGGFIAKFSPAGVLRWVRSLPLGVRNVAVDPRGHIAVSGVLDSPADFGGGTLTDVGHPFIARYSANGTFRWAITDPVPDIDGDLAADEDGDLYLAARADSSFGISPYLRRISRSGQLEWNRVVDTAGIALSVAARGKHVVLGAVFAGTLRFGGKRFEVTNSTGLVATYSATGRERWARALGSDNAYVTLDDCDAVLATGRYATGDDLGQGPPAPGVPGERTNMYVARLDLGNGRTEWVRTIPFGGLTPAEISVTKKGAPAVAGSFGGPVDFGTGLLVPVSDDVFTVQFER
ncbi:hypothetical protein P2318_32690 [Myxococcaceae bacterium GXIMD 01537]